MRVARFTFFIVLFVAAGISVSHAQDISLTLSVDKTALTTNDSINVTVTVNGLANTPQPQLPNLEKFNLIFGPSISTRTSIVNGVVSVSRGFTYVLKPMVVGKLTIGAFTLEHDGATYRSNEITVDVLDKSASRQLQNNADAANLNKKIFVELVTDKKEAYIYEQVVLTFRLYYQKGLPVADLEYVEPDTRNFIKENMGKQKQYEVVRNGIIYNVIELNMAIFPVVSGELKILPAKALCNIIVKSRRKLSNNVFTDSFFDDFFVGDQKKYPVHRVTDAITMPVKPLPEAGKPSDFKGTVGKFALDVEAKPAKLNVGDPVTLTINVTGAGNIQTISEPVLQHFSEKDFKVYPSETETVITSRKNGIKGKRSFSKVIEPRNVDVSQTPAVSFSFFDPESGKYKTVVSGPVAIDVGAVSAESPIRLYVRESAAEKNNVSIITRDILPNMADLTDFEDANDPIYKSPLLIAIFFAPLVAVIASIFAQKRRQKLTTDVGFARSRRARSAAIKALGSLDSGTADDVTATYSRLSNTVTNFLADKLNTTSASITAHNVADILKERNIRTDIADRVVTLLDLCDYGRFAKDSAVGKGINDAVASATELINKLDKQI